MTREALFKDLRQSIDGGRAGDVLIQNSEAIRNFALIIGGAFGLYLAWLRVTAANRQAEAATRQAELGRRAHVADLFTKAAGQLSDDRLEVRLAAIYTLREIGRDFPDLGGVVFELLSAYLRNHRQLYPAEGEPPADIREIMRILPEQLERDYE